MQFAALYKQHAGGKVQTEFRPHHAWQLNRGMMSKQMERKAQRSSSLLDCIDD
jgi:hypothetical protein